MQEKLAAFHLSILIYMTQVGVTILVLPRLLSTHFGTNGWLSLFIISFVATINIALISAVYRMGEGKSIFDIMERAVPKWLLYPFYVFFVCVWALIGCMTAKYYVLVFQMIAFPTMNPMIFKFAFDVLVFMLVIKSIYNISKSATIFFWLISWMTLLLFMFYKEFQWARLTPFLFQDSHQQIKGFLNIYAAFLGFELSLLLIPYCDRKTKFGRSIMFGNLWTTFNYWYVGFILFGFYGYEALRHLQFPLLNLLAYIQLPFIQATENLLYAFILNSAIMTSVMYFWSAKEVAQRMIPASSRLLAFIIMSVSFGIAYIPDVLSEVQHWLEYLSYLEIGIAMGLPVCLIAIIWIQGRKGKVANG
ncbi:MAG: spore gernimation protein [Paenibacillus sp.]|jgi:spore germination protein (amino acid permease)|nr:spore gernimation protein [Paenibacillus sp.]